MTLDEVCFNKLHQSAPSPIIQFA